MRVFLLAFIVLCCTTLRGQAQDVILRTTGEEIPARVLGITLSEVQYVPITGAPSPDTLHITVNEVFMIRYANGTRVLLNNTTASAPNSALGRTTEEMTNQGRMDAQKYFKALGNLFATAAATTAGLIMFGPRALGALGGIAAGAGIAAAPVQEQNIIVPDKALLNNQYYLQGYQKQAQRKKLGKAAGGFGIGFVTGTSIWLAIALANTNHF